MPDPNLLKGKIKIIIIIITIITTTTTTIIIIIIIIIIALQTNPTLLDLSFF
jgi:hypothetical protein